MLVNENFKLCREKRGITQEEVAEKLYTSKSFVSQLESGKVKIPLERAIQIADILDCSLDELVGRTTDQINRKENQMNGE